MYPHTLTGSETPDSVSLSQAVFPVVFLVQFGHVLEDHVLIHVTWERARGGLDEATVLRVSFNVPHRSSTQETAEH